MNTFFGWVAWAARIGVLAGGAAIGWALLRRAYDDARERWVKREEERLDLDRQRMVLEYDTMRHQVVVLARDEWGRAGIAYDGQVFRDLDTRAAFTQDLNLALAPVLEQLHMLLEVERARARATPPSHYHNEYIVGDQVAANADGQDGMEEGELAWATYPIAGLLGGREPSLERLVIGARPSVGGVDVVTRSLHDLMHVLAVGASGWGKSTWLRAFLYQVARAPEAVEVCAIDTSGSALNAIRGWGKLRYPLARDVNDACAVLAQVREEIAQRRRLYEQYPHVENLQEYNRATGQDLPPWIVLCDEGTHMLHHKGMGEPLREVVQTARQYGIYQLLAGQTAHSKVIETEIRDQYSSRLCFHTSPPSSRTVLDDRAAANLRDKGRMMCQLVGTELLELQGPWVTKEEFMGALSNGGARYEMPVGAGTTDAQDGTDGDDEREDRIITLAEEGWSQREIEEEVFGYCGGTAHREVKRVLEVE